MRRPGQTLATAAFALAIGVAHAAKPVVIEETDRGVRVLLGGDLFAEYRAKPGETPIVWPIRGPGGHEMTRRWPLAEALSTESQDHPHHRSLWFAHGDVNGNDFWHAVGSVDPDRPRIGHREFLSREVVDGAAVIRTSNDWFLGKRSLLGEIRTLRFYAAPSSRDRPQARVIDFTTQLTANADQITFGDTKEGTFAVRVPGAMKVDAGREGRIENDAGRTNAGAWGRPARWVKYSGPLDEAVDDRAPLGGIVLMNAPGNPQPRCRWHVREYGLFAANPFGEKDFPSGETTQGPVTLSRGESLTLRFVAVFYAGEAGPRAAEAWYNKVFPVSPPAAPGQDR